MPIQKITTGVIESSQTLTTPTISGNLSLDSTGTTGVRVPSANTMTFHTAGTEDMRITSAGDVGIGNTSPVSKFHVSSTTNRAYATIESTATTAGPEAGVRYKTANREYLNFCDYDSQALRWYDVTSAAERMRIDSAGRVTTPVQPAFSAYSTQNFNGTSQTPIQFSVTDFNIGSNYNTSTYRFTAPIAGRYLFTTGISFYLNGNSRQNVIALRKNGGGYISADCFIAGVQGNNTHVTGNINAVMELAASDYVDVSWEFSTASVNFYSDNKRCYFTGYLLG
jgi:hypothetical protein